MCFRPRNITTRLRSLPRRSRIFRLTPNYIEYIHDELLSVEWPGVETSPRADHRDRGLLESAVARPFHTACGKYIHRGLPRKGAALFHSIIANHPFGDGNKRTAVTALHHFLMANSVLLAAKNKDMYDVAVWTASSGERHIPQDELLKQLTEILKDRSVPITEIHEHPQLTHLYRHVSASRRRIRTNPLNRSTPPS